MLKSEDVNIANRAVHDVEVEVVPAPSEADVESTDAYNPDGDTDDVQLMMSYSLVIAANTKLLRRRLGIRQKDLAKAMNSSQGQIASLEIARKPINLSTLTRLGQALKVAPHHLLVPMLDDEQPASDDGETKETVQSMAEEAVQSDVVHPVQAAPPPPKEVATAASHLLAGGLAVGVSLTTVKGIVAAVHKRLEALERRHGSVPMTREMLTSILVVLLSASQNLDNDEDGS